MNVIRFQSKKIFIDFCCRNTTRLQIKVDRILSRCCRNVHFLRAQFFCFFRCEQEQIFAQSLFAEAVADMQEFHLQGIFLAPNETVFQYNSADQQVACKRAPKMTAMVKTIQ